MVAQSGPTSMPIKGFGSKLMVASKSINNIPAEYLSYCRNARIYDGGIGPRAGKELLINSTIGTVNRGGFVMNGNLYQVAAGFIYEIDPVTGVQTQKGDLYFDTTVDIIVYGTDVGANSSAILCAPAQELQVFNGTSLSVPTTVGTYSLKWTAPYNSQFIIGETLVGSISGAQAIVKSVNYAGITVTVGCPTPGVSSFVTGENLSTIGGTLRVSNITTITYNPIYGGILEYCRGFTFLAEGNVLYTSSPITSDHPEYAYMFTGIGSQTITFDSTIRALKGTLDGLYVFTDNQVHLIDANSLQNVAGSATFISRPLGDGSAPVNNLCVVASGQKIFYITKSLHVNTINYIQYTSDSSIGELSAVPVIGIKEFLRTIDVNQPTAFGFYNGSDKTIQMHLRSQGSGFNDVCLVYDLVNETWNVDTGKNYNYVCKNLDVIYGFSDVNTSVYIDDTGYSDAGIPIDFHIKTQYLNQGAITNKNYHGFFTAGGIGNQTQLEYKVNIDGQSVFQDYINGTDFLLPDQGEIGGSAIGDDPIGGNITYVSNLVPFDRTTDEGRIYQVGKRIQIEISSSSQIQDFILDILGVIAEPTSFIDLADKF